MKIIDLSPELYTNMPVYPGDPEVRIQQVHTLKNEGWRLRYIEMPSHIGAHVDAFSHMDENGKTLSELPIERFIGETIKVQLEDEFPFSVGLMFGRGELDIVLLDKLVRANPGFVVVGDKATLTVELERQLLQKGIITITDLINLDQLPFDQVFTLYAVPLNIKDGDGSPVRAFAIVE
ncbi:cyclase family protein [candidate division WWE3 bacterium]|uniref:Cyclase family protein n=1 Tax=candidate division WWE3 bacterium TaxID=2053526 RepID=A0A955RS58_UNCKA|nr:cyclase family protein [candidate division WWE3 bacterium]